MNRHLHSRSGRARKNINRNRILARMQSWPKSPSDISCDEVYSLLRYRMALVKREIGQCITEGAEKLKKM